MLKLFCAAYKYLNKKRFFTLFSILITILVVEIILTIYIPEWRKLFFTGIEAKNEILMYKGLLLFGFIVGGIALIQSVKSFVHQRVSLYLRNALTIYLTGKWDRDVYNDNPSQRINEDSKLATTNTFDVLCEIFISFGIVVALIIHNWDKHLIITASIVYSVGVLLMAYIFNKKLKHKDIDLQVSEANHRQALTAIDLGVETKSPMVIYDTVKGTFLSWTNWSLIFNVFNKVQGNFAVLVPYVLLVPVYFIGTITFGDMMEQAAIFDLIVINGTIVLSQYFNFIKAQASWHRLVEFHEKL